MGSKCCCAKDRKGQRGWPGNCCGDSNASDTWSSSSYSSGEDGAAFPSSKSAWFDDDSDSQTGLPLITKTGKKKRPTEGEWTIEKASRRAAEGEKREEARISKKQRAKNSLDKAVEAAHAAPSGRTSADLAAALQQAQSAGVSDREPRVIAAKKIMSERGKAAQKALVEAMRSKKFTVLRAAVEEARNLGLDCEELADAEAMLLQEKQRLLASAAVTAPVSNRDIAMLWRRVSMEKKHGEEAAPEVAGMESSHREESEAATRARDNLAEQAELAALQEELQEAEARQVQAAKGAMAGEQRKVAAMYGLASSALQRDVVKLQDAIKEGLDAGLEAKEMHAAWAVLSAEQKRLQARPSTDGVGSSTDSRSPHQEKWGLQDVFAGFSTGGSEPSVQRDSFGPFAKRGPSLAEQFGPATSSFPQRPAESSNSMSPAAATLIYDDLQEVNFGAFRGGSLASTLESSSVDGGSQRPSLASADSPEPVRVVSLHEYHPAYSAAVRRASAGSRTMQPGGDDDYSKLVEAPAPSDTGGEESAQAGTGETGETAELPSDIAPSTISSTGEHPRRNSRLLELD